MTAKKYEFTGETKEWEGRTLRRIRRISDGRIGGWIENEDNLCNDPKTLCWIQDEAIACDGAMVRQQASLIWKAKAYEKAKVFGCAKLYGQAEVFGHAEIGDLSEVSDQAKAFGWAELRGRTLLYGTMKASRSPLQVNLADTNITIADEMVSFCGKVYPFADCRERFEEIAKLNGYSKRTIELFRNVLFLLMDHQETLGNLFEQKGKSGE